MSQVVQSKDSRQPKCAHGELDCRKLQATTARDKRRGRFGSTRTRPTAVAIAVELNKKPDRTRQESQAVVRFDPPDNNRITLPGVGDDASGNTTSLPRRSTQATGRMAREPLEPSGMSTSAEDSWSE